MAKRAMLLVFDKRCMIAIADSQFSWFTESRLLGNRCRKHCVYISVPELICWYDIALAKVILPIDDRLGVTPRLVIYRVSKSLIAMPCLVTNGGRWCATVSH